MIRERTTPPGNHHRHTGAHAPTAVRAAEPAAAVASFPHPADTGRETDRYPGRVRKKITIWKYGFPVSGDSGADTVESKAKGKGVVLDIAPLNGAQ